MNKSNLQLCYLSVLMIMILGCGQNKTLEELATRKQAEIVKDDKAYLKQY